MLQKTTKDYQDLIKTNEKITTSLITKQKESSKLADGITDNANDRY
jgi:hypothetical protein